MTQYSYQSVIWYCITWCNTYSDSIIAQHCETELIISLNGAISKSNANSCIPQHDEIIKSCIAQHGEIKSLVLHNMVKSLNLGSRF